MIGRALGLVGLLLWGAPVLAEPPVLRVGVIAEPPFAMKDSTTWDGISVDLFAALASDLGLRYQLVETDRSAIVQELADGQLDVAVGPIAISAADERLVDFTHTYYQSALGVAEASVRRLTVRALLLALGSGPLLATLGLLSALTFLVGTLVWAAERRRNPGQFEPAAARGLWSGFWWSSSTLTTVGYGDKAPITVVGRGIGILWMFGTMLLLAVVTAQLSATLTADRITSRVNTVSDLSRLRVGNVAGAASLGPLDALHIRPKPFADVATGLKALSAGKIDAFVHDDPVLLWAIRSDQGIGMAPLRFAPENLVFAVPEGSPMLEPMNRALLDLLASDRWTIILRLYLGPMP